MKNIKYQVFKDVEWVYPDSEITNANGKVILHSARGTDISFQLLTDIYLDKEEDFSFQLKGINCGVRVYQLLPAHVSENSGAECFTTKDYETVKDFVTRKAPFDVYEITKEIKNGKLLSGRVALFIRLDIPSDVLPMQYNAEFTLNIGQQSFAVPVDIKVYNVVVPTLNDSKFHMVNWIYYDLIAKQHSCEIYSKEYLEILEKYLENQIDMRSDMLMLPSGEPVKDADGNIIDFDFSKAEIIGNLALKKGFRYVMGGFVGGWNTWSDPEIYTLWDRTVSVTTIEGFCQLKKYFTRAYECVVKNGWLNNYMQCMLDEPQTANAAAYRIMGAICRQAMPGIKINDPVESPELGGGLDIWVVKQWLYDDHHEKYKKIQDSGEEIWIYTCGFPAGKTMNRVVDLPLTVSRLPMWVCFKCNCPGFLHWGYHCATQGPIEGIVDCSTQIVGKENRYPPGNAHIVYSAKDGVDYSVRGHAQRTGAVDYELLTLLAKKDALAAKNIVDSMCTNFTEYEPSPEKFEQARIKILESLE